MTITQENITAAFKGLDKLLKEIGDTVESYRPVQETEDHPRQTYIDFEEPMYNSPQEELEDLSYTYGDDIPRDAMSKGLQAYMDLQGTPDEYIEDEPYCVNCHNIMLIDGIINNTLTRPNSIELHTAETLIKLSTLKAMILEMG